MSEKSDDLLLYLRQNKSLKSSTIESLISYGFDSNDTLIALDFGLDFEQMKDISLGQKSILRNILIKLKIYENKSIDKNESIFDNCIESQLLFEEMKHLLNSNNHKNNEELNELQKKIEEKDKEIQKYENESKIRDKKIENLRTKLKEMQEREQELKNEFKKQMSVNKNSLEEVKTLLLTRSQTNKTQNSRNKEKEISTNI
jgi:DNA gyrase/topoisomerase IV subunit A